MSVDPNALLRALGLGVLPKGVESNPQTRLIEGPSFQEMLDNVGGASSGLPVRVARTAGVDLSASQLNRLAAAADRAEAAGATKALFMIDGKVLQMDVGLRTITGQADLSTTKVLNGVDAVVTVAPDAGELPGQVPALSAGAMNASLLRILGGSAPPRA